MIIDGEFLSEEQVSAIEQGLLGGGRKILYTFQPQTSRETPKQSPRISSVKESFQLVAPIIPANTPDVVQDPALKEAIADAFNTFMSKYSIDVQEVTRIKVNILTREKEVDRDKHHLPHVDTKLAHYVFLYYVNDSDGDTLFFNQWHKGDYTPDPNSFVVEKRVAPKRGTAVVFDGHQFHASSSPVDSEYRCIINIDFTTSQPLEI